MVRRDGFTPLFLKQPGRVKGAVPLKVVILSGCALLLLTGAVLLYTSHAASQEQAADLSEMLALRRAAAAAFEGGRSEDFTTAFRKIRQGERKEFWSSLDYESFLRAALRPLPPTAPSDKRHDERFNGFINDYFHLINRVVTERQTQDPADLVIQEAVELISLLRYLCVRRALAETSGFEKNGQPGIYRPFNDEELQLRRDLATRTGDLFPWLFFPPVENKGGDHPVRKMRSPGMIASLTGGAFLEGDYEAVLEAFGILQERFRIDADDLDTYGRLYHLRRLFELRMRVDDAAFKQKLEQQIGIFTRSLAGKPHLIVGLTEYYKGSSERAALFFDEWLGDNISADGGDDEIKGVVPRFSALMAVLACCSQVTTENPPAGASDAEVALSIEYQKHVLKQLAGLYREIGRLDVFEQWVRRSHYDTLISLETAKQGGHGTASARSPQESLLQIAKWWHVLGNTAALRATREALDLRKENVLHESYLLYVDVLYLIDRRMWNSAKEKLERLRRLVFDYKSQPGRTLPLLKLADLGALYQFVAGRQTEWGSQEEVLQKADRILTRLLAGKAFELYPLPALTAGLRLARTYLQKKQYEKMDLILRKLHAVWDWDQWMLKSSAGNKPGENPDVFLEMELIQCADLIKKELMDAFLSYSNPETVAMLFHHLRTLSASDAGMRLEGLLCKKRAEQEEDLSASEKRSLFRRAAELLENTSSTPDDNFMLGRCFYEAGDYEKAEKLFEVKKRNEKALLFLADTYRKQGRFSEAMETYDKVVKQEGPGAQDAMLRQLMLLSLHGPYNEATFRRGRELFTHLYNSLLDVNHLWKKAVFYFAELEFQTAVQPNRKGRKECLRNALGRFQELKRRFPRKTGIFLEELNNSDMIYKIMWRTGEIAAYLDGPLAAAQSFKALEEKIKQEARGSGHLQELRNRCLLKRADLFFTAKKWNKALELYSTVGRIYSRSEPVNTILAYFRQGRCAVMTAEFDLALSYFRQGLQQLEKLDQNVFNTSPWTKEEWAGQFRDRIKRTEELKPGK